MPHSAEGILTEPPVSVPKPAAHIRAAIAAPFPPLLPPGISVGLYGLWTAPKAPLLLVMPYASSCILVLPSRMAPAENNFAATGASELGRRSRSAGVPALVGALAVSMLSFMRIGSPWSGPRRFVVRSLSAARAVSKT